MGCTSKKLVGYTSKKFIVYLKFILYWHPVFLLAKFGNSVYG